MAFPLKLNILKRGFIKYNETISLLQSLASNFPSLISSIDIIGSTIENRSIYSIKITTNRAKNIPTILFTGLHHAREPISLTMNLYLIVKVLFDYYKEDTVIREVLDQKALVFVPALNVDGYEKIKEIYERNWFLNDMIRKNRRVFNECEK